LKYYEKYNNSAGSWVDRWVQAHELLLINFAEDEANRYSRASVNSSLHNKISQEKLPVGFLFLKRQNAIVLF